MEKIYFLLSIISVLTNVALILAVIVLTGSFSSRLDELRGTIDKQSELIVILSQMVRKEDLRKTAENTIFERIQSSIRDFNNRFNSQFKMNVVDDDKPLEFPNDEK